MTDCTRHQYSGVLAKSLRPDERPEDKLPHLMAELRATFYLDAIVILLDRHVIGHNVRNLYPLQVRSSARKYGDAVNRLPALYAFVGSTDDEEVLLFLAVKHVPGFQRRPENRRRGGRPHSMKLEDQAWLVEIIDQIMQDDRAKGHATTVLSVAASLAQSQPEAGWSNPFHGKTPEWLEEIYHHQKRADKQFLANDAKNAIALQRMLPGSSKG